jgi:hypothetical protein
MSIELTFLEHFMYIFTLENLEDGELEDYEEDEYNYRAIMKYLLDNKENKVIVEQDDAWNLTEGCALGNVVIGFLENKILPVLPEYSEEQLASVDKNAEVEITFLLKGIVDMSKDANYTNNGSSFWDMGDCPDEDHDEFEEFVRDKTKDYKKDEIVEEDIANDITNEGELSYEYSGIADIIQWRYLNRMYYEFQENQD